MEVNMFKETKIRAMLLGVGLFLFIAQLFIFTVSSTAADKAPAEIRIGLMFGLTGPASPIGPVQLEGAKIAVKAINEGGGVNIGGKKVPLVPIVRDDETKVDTAIRRYRELVNDQKIDFLVGTTDSAIDEALNQEVKRIPRIYFPVDMASFKLFPKNSMAETTFCIHGNDYSIGYADAAYIINQMGYKKILFFGPAYAFGRNQLQGAKDAAKKYGASIEVMESPFGTSDYTSYLLKIMEMKPEIVMMAHWGTDAINVLKQSYEINLREKTKIFFNWMTQVFGMGVPPEAIKGVYSMMSWYYNLEGFEDLDTVERARKFTDVYVKEYGAPPDPYAAAAYMGVKEAVRAVEVAKSTDPHAMAKAILSQPDFDSIRGPATWRVDHVPVYKYGAFIVVGKGREERKDEKTDIVKVIGAYKGKDYLPSLASEGY
jgi:branched-chain amino acid transport system substrate-binding protein